MMSMDQTITSQNAFRIYDMFETKGGKEKPLGIHYPLGMAKIGFPARNGRTPKEMKKKSKKPLNNIEIFRPQIKTDTCPTRTIITESMV